MPNSAPVAPAAPGVTPRSARHVQELLDHALHDGGSFSSRHRFLDTEQAFTLLMWRSRETNTTLRVLADSVVAELSDIDVDTDGLRRRFDHMVLTVHQRVSTRTDGETEGA